MTSAFISYSWDGDAHKLWVRDLATRLHTSGVDIKLDQWHLIPGDQLPEFMESAVRESDFVLVICTPRYKTRSDNRAGGVGYEGDIMTAEVMTTRSQRKFIPILPLGPGQTRLPHGLLENTMWTSAATPIRRRSLMIFLQRSAVPDRRLPQ